MMIKVVLALLGILASSQAQAAGEKQATLGLSSGASPNTVCIFDLSATRPCVQMGVLDSVAHIFTVKSPGFSVDVTGDVSLIHNLALIGGVPHSANGQSAYYWTGSVTGTCAPTNTSFCAIEQIIANSINVANTTPNVTGMVNMTGNIGGNAQTGGTRWANFSFLVNNATQDNYSNGGVDYIALSAQAGVSAAIGNSNSANHLGGVFASNFTCHIYSTATYVGGCVGAEFDIIVDGTGTAAPLGSSGVQIVVQGTSFAAGSHGDDTGLRISGGPRAWDYGVAFGGYNGNLDVKTTGTLIGCFPHGGAGLCNDSGGANNTVTNGVDFSLVAFTGSAFKSPGFSIDGTGIVTGASYKAGAAAGVTCSGSPTASFASTGGIVTHC